MGAGPPGRRAAAAVGEIFGFELEAPGEVSRLLEFESGTEVAAVEFDFDELSNEEMAL
jgi:hypothetical protein